MEKMFLLTNIRSKCVIRKINLFFDVMKDGESFSFKSLSFSM